MNDFEQNTTFDTLQNSNILICELCDYKCFDKSNYKKHLFTKKHKKMVFEQNKNTIEQNTINNTLDTINNYMCKNCNKIYKNRNGLWYHRKKCNNEGNNNNNKIQCNNNDKNEGKIDMLINEHIDFKNILIELVKSNTELQKQMLEVCKNSNTTINNNNNNSKTFNMQVFLNEKCKDAMNIMDFVDSMNLQLSDLEELGELGYVEGISRQMIRKLSELDVYKRPIHCSDLKRETIYIRDNGVWEKENITYDKLRKAIKYVTAKNGYLLEPWRDAHPQCMNTQHPLNDVYVQIMSQAMGGRGEFADSENKIIKKVSKVITIDKNNY